MKLRPLKSSFLLDGKSYPASALVEAANEANSYFVELDSLFIDLDFQLFQIMGQRNISGVIGEFFSRFFCRHFSGFLVNPHPDGRPDVLCLRDEEVRKYFDDNCVQRDGDREMPVKSLLTPFKYGGLEIKSTIGDPHSNYRATLKKERGLRRFEVGIPRVQFLNGLSYWAHHVHATTLMGLYYDYYKPANCVPQILAIMCARIEEDDWHVLSRGNPDKKKTSNTSLNSTGLGKMKDGILIATDDAAYCARLRAIGLSV